MSLFGNPYLDIDNGQLKVSVKMQDTPALDAFGRQRVSNPFPVFNNKNIFSKNSSRWEEKLNGVGSSVTHLPNEAAVELGVGTVSGEFAYRQTIRYNSYVPGKSQQIIMTGVLGSGQENTIRRIGYFDDNDGLFFELNGTTVNVVKRSSTSGTPVDERIPQYLWNKDRFDGIGGSKMTLDTTKTQIFHISFAWLGVGRAVFGFDVDGTIVYCHEFKNSNNLSKVFMATPTLPLRYEIRNIGITALPSTLKEICCSVSSEGGFTLPGSEFAASNGIGTRTITTTKTPLFAIRLLNTFNGKANRKTIRLIKNNLYVSGNDVYFELIHVHNVSAITGTWNNVSTDSAVEYSSDISAITGSEHIIDNSFLSSGAGNSANSIDMDLNFINIHSYLSQNIDSNNSQVFLIKAQSFAGTADVSGGLDWIEFD